MGRRSSNTKGERSMLKFLKAYGLAALVVLGLASYVAPRAAAQTAKIAGNIIDFEGKPWAGLTIKLKSEQGAIQETKTAASGDFDFTNVRSGKYTVIVSTPQIAQPFEVITEVHGADTP